MSSYASVLISGPTVAHELTPTLDDDAPALAGAIVYHAKTLCDQVNTLWRLLNQFSIPVAKLTDTRNQNKATFSTESMARLYIYKTIHDLTQSKLADRLANRPALLKGFGMIKPPTQQNISSPGTSSMNRRKIRLKPQHEGFSSKPTTMASLQTRCYHHSLKKMISKIARSSR